MTDLQQEPPHPKEENEKKEEKMEIEEKELSPLEEDRKELYDAINDLKPEDVNDNIKTKLLSLAEVYLEQKKIEDEQFETEYDILQDKYDKQYINIYDKIDQIIKSKDNIEISPEEYERYGIKEEGESHEIEDYWQKVILNSRYFTINEKDKTIIKYIKKVNLVKFPENVNINNFRVDFTFQPNEFFTPEVLSKTYEFSKDGTLKKAIGTDIQWKSKEKNPTIEKVQKKIKKGKKVSHVTKEEKVDSFFSFFTHVDDMTFLNDEVTFFKEDLFLNQLEYYLDIVSKKKNGGSDNDDLDDEGDDYNGHEKEEEVQNLKPDGNKEECKQQ